MTLARLVAVDYSRCIESAPRWATILKRQQSMTRAADNNSLSLRERARVRGLGLNCRPSMLQGLECANKCWLNLRRSCLQRFPDRIAYHFFLPPQTCIPKTKCFDSASLKITQSFEIV